MTDTTIVQFTLIALVIAAFSATILLFKIFNAFKNSNKNFVDFQSKITTNFPDKNTINTLIENGKALQSAMLAHKLAVEGLSNSLSSIVSTQVDKGLQPLVKGLLELRTSIRDLSTELEKSHQSFIGAFATISDEGHLQDWIAGFREAVVPLRKASDAIEVHYQTADRLVKETHEFVNRWSGHWEVVSTKISHFDESFCRWVMDENSHQRAIESRIFARLEEVGKNNAIAAENLRDLNSASSKLHEATQESSLSIKLVADRMNTFVESQKMLQNQHENSISKMNTMQDMLNSWQNDKKAQNDALMTQLNNGILAFRNAINNTAQNQQTHNSSLIELNDEILKSNSKAFNEITNKFSNQIKEIKTISDTLRSLPIRALQIVEIVLLIIIVGGILVKY